MSEDSHNQQTPTCTLEALDELVELARTSGRLALDTEFVGEGRYRTLLCLVALAVPDGEQVRVELLDPLAGELDGAPLAEILRDPLVQVVVHAGRQDIALMRRRFQTELTNVFDTQVAAGFAGFAAQSSYDSLLSEVLGLRLAKTASFTRWDARPLSAEQLSYARDDALHLLELSSGLERRLRTLGRLEWAREECEPLEHCSDERDLESVFARLPRINGLSARSRPIARELVQWREQTAARHDRPVQSVLGDAALVEIARRGPTSRAELERIRGVSAGRSGKRGDDLLQAIERGRRRPVEPAPQTARQGGPKPDDAPLVALAEALLRARARESQLAYELLATRSDLQAIVVGARSGGREADVRTLRGWRRELVGSQLLKLLDGEVSLSVGERCLIVEEHPHSG
jgi:ribonuclease D